MDAEVTVDEKAKKLTIVMPLQKPARSKSGKTMVIATTRGNQKTDAKYQGNLITIGVNAYYKAGDDDGDSEEAPKKKKKKDKEEEVEADDDDD